MSKNIRLNTTHGQKKIEKYEKKVLKKAVKLKKRENMLGQKIWKKVEKYLIDLINFFNSLTLFLDAYKGVNFQNKVSA